MNKGNFVPPVYLRNPVLQTILSSVRKRNAGSTQFELEGREVIIDAGNGVRLSGFYSAVSHDQGFSAKKGLIILLHGWEGSEKSAYMVASGRFFYKLGYDIFRLNMRDHGNSHHLNKGLFLGTLIEEAYGAVKEIIQDYGKSADVFILGFSMGANFALRIASLSGAEKNSSEKNAVKKIIAVNPPLNPLTATANIDKYFIIRKYFLKKWKRSLIKKQNAFPDLYDFTRYLKTDNCIALTRYLVEEYSEYAGIEDYFGRYTLRKEFFIGIKTPVAVITAADDPIINISDFNEIREAGNSFIDLCVEPYGGHCAYIKDYRFNTWLFGMILEKLG